MGKREMVEPHKGDKRYVRRGVKGEFTDKPLSVGRSLVTDRRSKSKTVVKIRSRRPRRPAPDGSVRRSG
jgi:hypothetical protein